VLEEVEEVLIDFEVELLVELEVEEVDLEVLVDLEVEEVDLLVDELVEDVD
jgi:hypothetical protein